MQLDMFNNSDVTLLKEEILSVKTSSDKVRRGMFARHNELAKMYVQQQNEIEALKTAIYRFNVDSLYELKQA